MPAGVLKLQSEREAAAPVWLPLVQTPCDARAVAGEGGKLQVSWQASEAVACSVDRYECQLGVAVGAAFSFFDVSKTVKMRKVDGADDHVLGQGSGGAGGIGGVKGAAVFVDGERQSSEDWLGTESSEEWLGSEAVRSGKIVKVDGGRVWLEDRSWFKNPKVLQLCSSECMVPCTATG